MPTSPLAAHKELTGQSPLRTRSAVSVDWSSMTLKFDEGFGLLFLA
jgi:hypothetical protein